MLTRRAISGNFFRNKMSLTLREIQYVTGGMGWGELGLFHVHRFLLVLVVKVDSRDVKPA
jgi:hypothetical protein